MTIPSKKQSVGERLAPSTTDIRTDETHLTDTGAIASPAPNAKGEAGETLSSQPHSRSIGLLLEALSALAWKGDVHAAAGVYSRMKRLDPTFSFESEGFKSFRELLETAQLDQFVVVERVDGASDLQVRSTLLLERAPAVSQGRSVGLRINPDLWRALLDWDPDARYLFRRVDGRTIKSMTLTADQDHVVVPSIARDEQLEWMREFAASQDDEILRGLLLSALQEDVPVRGFSRAVRNLEAEGRRWKRFLKKRVLDRAMTWATAQSIPISAIENVDSTKHIEGTPLVKIAVTDDAQLRARVLSILASMPLSELLRLPIPVEFALKP